MPLQSCRVRRISPPMAVLCRLAALLLAYLGCAYAFKSHAGRALPRSSWLHMSDDDNLLEQMRRALGETEDVFESVEKESKQLLQGLR